MAPDAFSIMLSLLLFMFGLVVIGEPLRIMMSRLSSIFNRLDIIQVIVIDVYLGGFILYVIALIPLHLFRSSVLWGILLLSALLILIYYTRELLVKKKIQITWRDAPVYLVISLIFLVVLFIEITPTTSFIFGNVHDSSLFSLFAKIILDNEQIVETLYPYLPEGIIYPQGFFTLVASANIFLKMNLAEIPLRITPLFQALTVLATYYLGKEISGRKLGLSFAFIFAFVSMWPRLLVWGSNAFVAGFPLYFICLSLVPSILQSRSEKLQVLKPNTLFVIGLLFGYLAAIHLTLCQVLVFTLLAGGLVRVLRSTNKRNSICSMSKRFLCLFVAALIPIGVFVYRAIKWYHYPGHNLGLPSDIVSAPISIFNVVDWVLISDGISPYPVLRTEIVVLILSSVAVFVIFRQRLNISRLKNVIEIISISIVGALLQFSLSLMQSIFPAIGLYAGELARPIILLFVSLLMTIGIFNVILWRDFGDLFRKRFGNPVNQKSLLNRLRLVTITILMLLPLYTPFLYYTFGGDVRYLTGQYNMFCITTQDDVELMQWMDQVIDNKAKVLINPYEAGSFIPLLSGVENVIYPFTASRHSESYKILTTLIDQQILNLTAYQLIEEFGANYVFVGTYAMADRPKWDANLFIGNPNFKITKSIGDSYIFEILSTNPNLIFRDHFEYENLTERDWTYYVAGECLGNGSGQAIISSQHAINGTSSLMMNAVKTQGSYYANWIYRKVWFPSPANITISFHIDADCSAPHDFMAIIISDDLWKNKVYLATPNQHTSEYMTKLSAPNGFFTFDLSQLWFEKFDSTLPDSVYLEIQITDYDGVKDTGFIDNIMIVRA